MQMLTQWSDSCSDSDILSDINGYCTYFLSEIRNSIGNIMRSERQSVSMNLPTVFIQEGTRANSLSGCLASTEQQP